MKNGETRTYTVPLRKEYLKTPKWRRAEKAVSTLRSFAERHSKIEDIKIGKWVNESIWKRGAKNPPSRVRVDIKRVEDIVTVELSELPRQAKTKEIPKKIEEKSKVGKKASPVKNKVETKKIEEKSKVEQTLKGSSNSPAKKSVANKKAVKKTK